MTHNVSPSIVAATKRLLRVALVGAPNVGKSTLLNRLISSDISCVSNKVHTTRRNILGVVTEGNAQLEFYDSPGIVNRQHLLKHKLEDSIIRDPVEASEKCDLIAVVIDASNPRERSRLNRGILKILTSNEDKKSFLIMNKVDLVSDKRTLLDIGTRLSEGHIEGRKLVEWNKDETFKIDKNIIKPKSKFVIELDSPSNSESDCENEPAIQSIGYRNFSSIFSVSALTDDGIDGLRESMIQLASPLEEWPHGPDYMSNLGSRDIIHSIIRGKVMDNSDHEIPYLVKFKYLELRFDELGALHIELELRVPKKYMVGRLIGQQGATIFTIINESKDVISRTLACDVKLNINVKAG